MTEGETGGKDVGQQTFDELEEWSISHLINACCFDTAASNTGHVSVAIVHLAGLQIPRTLSSAEACL